MDTLKGAPSSSTLGEPFVRLAEIDAHLNAQILHLPPPHAGEARRFLLLLADLKERLESAYEYRDEESPPSSISTECAELVETLDIIDRWRFTIIQNGVLCQ